MLVINLFGGPGVGKTTLLHNLMAVAKKRGAKIECCLEYARELVLAGRQDLLKDQLSIFEEQLRRLRVFSTGTDFIVTDAPLFNGLVYCGDGDREALGAAIRQEWPSWNNSNYLLGRQFAYQTHGRYQDEAGAIQVDGTVAALLRSENLPFRAVTVDEALPLALAEMGLA